MRYHGARSKSNVSCIFYKWGSREAKAVAVKMKESCQGDARAIAYGREEIRIGQRDK